MQLNDLIIKNLKPKTTAYYVTDSNARRGYGKLSVKVLPSGQKHFYIQYRHESKRKFLPLGKYPALSLAEANKTYDEYKHYIYSGIDPREVIKERERERKTEIAARHKAEEKINMQGNLKQLIEFYLADTKKNKSSEYYKCVARAFKANLDVIDLELKAHEIIKDHILKILHPIAERGSLIMANRMRAYLSAMFQYGIEFDDSTEAISKDVKFHIPFNPVQSVKKPKKKEDPGIRVLSEREVYLFWQALDQSRMHVCRQNAFKLMLITGQRVEEVSRLRWSEIDGSYWILPAARTKNEREHLVVLTQLAQQILSDTPKLHNEYVFPAESLDRPLPTDGFSQALTRLLVQTSIEKFTPRDLRRTWKTLSGKAGLPKEIRDIIQNNARNDDVSSKHYDRYDYLSEKRHAMTKWGDYLQIIIDGTWEDHIYENVVQLKK